MSSQTITPKASASRHHKVGADVQYLKSRWRCPVKGCIASFSQHTDCSRHHWTHLPEDLYQRCPFIGCEHVNKPRGPSLKKHWESSHAGFPQEVEKWDTLRKILAKNNMNLGDKPPGIIRYSISQSPPPATPQHIEATHNSPFEGLGNTQSCTQWPPSPQAIPGQVHHAAHASLHYPTQPYYPPTGYSSAQAFDFGPSFPLEAPYSAPFPPLYDPSAGGLYPGLEGYFDPEFKPGLDPLPFSTLPGLPEGTRPASDAKWDAFAKALNLRPQD